MDDPGTYAYLDKEINFDYKNIIIFVLRILYKSPIYINSITMRFCPVKLAAVDLVTGKTLP